MDNFGIKEAWFPYGIWSRSHFSPSPCSVTAQTVMISDRTPCRASLADESVKNLPRCRRPGFDPWVRKIPRRRKWVPTPLFSSGKSHGQRSLVGYSPWSRKGLDMTESLNNNLGNHDVPKLTIHRVSGKPSTALLGSTTPPEKHREDRILTKISSPARL